MNFFNNPFRYDNITIFENSTSGLVSPGTYCGDINPPKFRSSGSYAEVLFISDHVVSKKGFEMSYTCMLANATTTTAATTTTTCGYQKKK